MKNPSELILRYLDGVATEKEVAQLEEQLRNSPELQDAYLESIELDCLLKHEAQSTHSNGSFPEAKILTEKKHSTKAAIRWILSVAAIFALFIISTAGKWTVTRSTNAATPSLGEVPFANSQTNSTLSSAAAIGDILTVKKELNSGANIDYRNDDGLTSLHLASIYGHSEVAIYLIENGADLNQVDASGNTALHIAAFLGRWLIVEELLEAGGNPEIRNRDGFNADDLVALNWNPNLERYYLYLEETLQLDLDFQKIRQARPRIRTTINQFMPERVTAGVLDETSTLVTTTARMLGKSLAYAKGEDHSLGLSTASFASSAMSGNLIGATFARVIPNRTQGSPPSVSLVQAARTGNIAAVNQHIKAGSDLNQRNDFDESTPIIVAAAFGRDDVVRALIEAGADLAATNNQRQTALHAAAFFCRQSTVEMLIAAKMDLAAVNYQGETAYDIVASPMTKELRYVYRYIYGLLKLDLDLEKIEAERENIAKTLFSHQQN